jgi:Na+/H+ antiporter NhaD/arsenite permease-like protein
LNLVSMFFIIFIIFCLFMIYYTSSQKTKFRKELQKKQQEKNSTLFITLSHIYGLPVAQNMLTQIFSNPNEYEFITGNTSFKLNKSKVTDVSITNNVEIQKNNVSSIGGAISGAILFGAVGAVIGGRSKEKTSNIIHSYLVFTFLDNNEIKYIAFNCTNAIQAKKFVEEFKITKTKEINNINL